MNSINTNNPIEVSKGGTGLATITSHGIMVGNGTGNVVPLAEATNGQIPIGSTGNPPVLASISSGTGISVTPGAGTITIANTAVSTAGVKVTTYTASDTWTKDTNAKWIRFYMWGAGQGGASGRRATSTTSGGGGGGGTGSLIMMEGPATIFDTTQTVTIAGTTTGAAGQGTNDTNGNGLSATAIGATLFGNIQSNASGASTGGTTTNGAAGSGATGYYIAANFAGPSGGNGTNTTGANAGNVSTNIPTGGGGGGGSGADSVTIRQAGNGSPRVRQDSTTIQAGGAGGIESGTINGGNGTDNIPGSTLLGVLSGGTGGGGGGGQSAGGVAGIGGNGGIPSGGGGGGGGSLNGTLSGAGGNGARGQLMVIEFLS